MKRKRPTPPNSQIIKEGEKPNEVSIKKYKLPEYTFIKKVKRPFNFWEACLILLAFLILFTGTFFGLFYIFLGS